MVDGDTHYRLSKSCFLPLAITSTEKMRKQNLFMRNLTSAGPFSFGQSSSSQACTGWDPCPSLLQVAYLKISMYRWFLSRSRVDGSLFIS